MKILHIDETFHPAFGYQCNPLAKFQHLQGHEIIILTVEKKFLYPVYRSFGENGERLEEQDKIYQETTGVKIVRIPAKGYFMNRLNYDKKVLFKMVGDIDPDVIFAHCFETLTALRILFRFSNQYPIVFDSHMLSMASTLRFTKFYEFLFRKFVTPVVEKKRLPVILTQNDSYVNEHLGVTKNLTPFVSFGTDTKLFCPSKEMYSRFRLEHNLPENTFIVVSTGKLSEAKGGMLLAKAVEKKFHTSREVVIVVVANLTGEYEKKVKQKLDQSENRILYYPVQDYLKLPYFYQIADVCIFPKQCSMSFYDAQACAVPVISENNNINVERNSHGNGFCFEQDNIADLHRKLEEMINMNLEQYKKMAGNSLELIRKSYDYELIAKQYTDILRNQIEVFQVKRRNRKAAMHE